MKKFTLKYKAGEHLEEATTNISNISQVIIDTINNLLNTLFSSVDNSVYQTLDDLAFINNDIFDNSFLSNILALIQVMD